MPLVVERLLPNRLRAQVIQLPLAAVHIDVLRPLERFEIAALALCKGHLGLLLIERIVPRVKRILEAAHIAVRMQLLPRMSALAGLARLEDHHERVEAVHDVLKGAAGDGVGAGGLGVGEVVADLSRIELSPALIV